MQGKYLLLVKGDDDRTWDVSGEGPFDSEKEATDFAEAECGVPWMVVRVVAEREQSRAPLYHLAWGVYAEGVAEPVRVLKSETDARTVASRLDCKTSVERVVNFAGNKREWLLMGKFGVRASYVRSCSAMTVKDPGWFDPVDMCFWVPSDHPMLDDAGSADLDCSVEVNGDRVAGLGA